jgi:hypothetical protein
MRDRADVRDVGAMRGNSRLFTEFWRSLWPRVHIRYSEKCKGRGVDGAARDACRCSRNGSEKKLKMFVVLKSAKRNLAIM